MRQALGHLTDGATVVIALCAVALTVMNLSDRAGLTAVPERSREAEIENWPRYSEQGVGHRVGPVDAAVTIVEFGDYQCPVCRNFEPHLRAVLRKYPNDVAAVYRHWPLPSHPLAYPAARAAECAGAQGQFVPFHTSLYDSGEWLITPKPAFLSIATAVGIEDMATFEECLDGVAPVDAIERDVAAALEVGGTGTPTVLINNRLLRGMRDSLQLGAVVEELLGESSAAASGP